MIDQRVAHRLAAAEQDVQYARWQQLLRQFTQAQGGQWGQFGRLDHHGVASGQSGSDLPGQHHQRVVPRGNRSHHAQRVAADHRGVARQVLAGRRTAQAARGTGKIAEHVGNGRDFVIQRGTQRLAAVLRFQPGQFIAMGLDGIRQRQQGLRAVLGAGLRPAVEGLVGGAHGAVHLGFGGFVDLRQGSAQRRVQYGPGRAFASDQPAIDQHLRLHRGLLQGHLPLPATLSPPRVR